MTPTRRLRTGDERQHGFQHRIGDASAHGDDSGRCHASRDRAAGRQDRELAGAVQQHPARRGPGCSGDRDGDCDLEQHQAGRVVEQALRLHQHLDVRRQRQPRALRWFTDEAFRRIGRQFNRGETLNELRRFIFYAHRGQILHRRHEDQTMRAHCHTLVVNAYILSTPGTWTMPSTRTAPPGTRSGMPPSRTSPGPVRGHQPLRATHLVLYAGLKGAVSILLGIFLLEAHVPGARRVCGIIAVVVMFSVVVQGSLKPAVARLQRPGQRGQDRAASPRQHRLADLALQDGDLMTQDEGLGVLSAV